MTLNGIYRYKGDLHKCFREGPFNSLTRQWISFGIYGLKIAMQIIVFKGQKNGPGTPLALKSTKLCKINE